MATGRKIAVHSAKDRLTGTYGKEAVEVFLELYGEDALIAAHDWELFLEFRTTMGRLGLKRAA